MRLFVYKLHNIMFINVPHIFQLNPARLLKYHTVRRRQYTDGHVLDDYDG